MTIPGTTPAPRTAHHSTAYGLSPAVMRLHRDEHGATHVDLDEDGAMSIRIQVKQGRYTTPEQHAAELERDRQGLHRLAELATEVAQEIEQVQRGEAGQ
jgi:hypothetical protein